METKSKVGQFVELITLEVLPENITAFLDERKKVDEFTGSLKGYIGTEILKVNDKEFLVLIRWDSEEAVNNAQSITKTAPVISDWLNRTAKFVSFETSISKYQN